MLNIVIPMAGHGSRFAKKGYSNPKPLIELHGLAMIRWVIGNLKPACPHRFIFICQQAHIEQYALDRKLVEWTAQETVVIGVKEVTQGAACTVLLAKEWINDESGLMIANSDQWVDFSIADYLQLLETNPWDGLIMTMTASDPKWSFARLDAQGLVTLVVEKQVISNEATVGIYNFRYGRDFVSGAERMIHAGRRVNGEFYVAPVYNELIEGGMAVGISNVGSESNGMYGIGIPEDLEKFLQDPRSRGFLRRLAL